MKQVSFIKIIKDNLGPNNGIYSQAFGICSALAVTTSVINTLVLSAAVIFTAGLSSFTLSLLRRIIPEKVYLLIQVIVIAFYVTAADIFFRAYFNSQQAALGPYIGLIITNCIIFGRVDSFARINGVFSSLIDGLTAGLGYMFVLLAVALIRELAGTGSVAGFVLLPGDFIVWNIMMMPAGAFFVLAMVIWIFKSLALKGGKRE